MRITIDYGIDLGTTNSAIARSEGTSIKLLEGPQGEAYLPSAVHMRSDGTILIGKSARAMIENDPMNTAIEFKRLMGSNEKVRFPASGKELTPVFLSAHILRELLSWTKQTEEVIPKGVVITVPAIFQLPQCEATRRAAELAWIEYAPLLQEPIAAAIAHAGTSYHREGYWMIYDFGGGTFDVSLVRSREGRLQVVDHDGDNHLGGKDFDRIIAQEAVQVIRQKGKLAEFKRSDPKFATAFAKLKIEAERVRIFLSEHEQAVFRVKNYYTTLEGEQLDFEMRLDRQKLEDLIRPTVMRSTALCKDLLKRNRLRSNELNGLVMVGGPTLTPCLPGIIQDELKIDARHYQNPMNIVAYGAALFASTQKLPPEFRPASTMPSISALELRLEFESMTTNPFPLLVGKFQPIPGVKTESVRVVRQDKKFDTGHKSLQGQNNFMIDLELQENCLNLFYIEIYNDKGQKVSCVPTEITIVHGMSVASPPLAQSVGVMLADNSVCWYLRKGVVLPARHRMTHATTVALKHGQSGEAINVPLIQGESNRADRNKTIGVLRIFAQKIAIDLPAGAEVEVTLIVDEFSHTTASAYVPLLDQVFDDVIMFIMEAKETEEVKKALTTQMDRLSDLDKLAEELEKEERADVDQRIKDVEALIEEGDRDSIDLADQMVRWMAQKIDVVEDINQTKILQTNFDELMKEASEIINKEGSQEEKSQFLALSKEFKNAIAKSDTKLAIDKKDEVKDLYLQVFSKTPEFWVAIFFSLVKSFEASGIGGENAKILMDRGAKAIENGSLSELYQITADLLKMLPQSERQKITSQIV